jgi:hypothetical protein
MAVAPFMLSLRGDLVFDDREAIVRNPVVQAPFDPARLLTSDFWGGNPDSLRGSYRPLTVLSFWVDQHLGAGRPVVFHATNLALHATVVLALFFTLLTQLGRPWLAFACAGLFAVHALHSENVAGVVGRADVLAAGLGLGAWAAARSARPARAAASGLLLLLGLLAKETTVAVLAWLAAEDLLRLRPGGLDRARRLAYVSCGAALVAYVGLRLQAIGVVAAPTNALSNPLTAVPLGTRLLTACALFWRAACALVAPIHLSADYSRAQIEPITRLAHPAVLAGLVLAVALAFAIVSLRRRGASCLALGLLMFVLAYAPVSNILTLPAIYAERLLYLPSIGFCLALAAGALALARRWPRAAWAAVGLAVVAHGARAHVRTLDWRTQRSLFASAITVTPRCARAWLNLGVEDLNDRNPALAAQRIGRAVELAPEWPLARAMHGVALDLDRQADAAEREFARGVELGPTCRACATNFLHYYVNHQRLADAAALFDRYAAFAADPELVSMRAALVRRMARAAPPMSP